MCVSDMLQKPNENNKYMIRVMDMIIIIIIIIFLVGRFLVFGAERSTCYGALCSIRYLKRWLELLLLLLLLLLLALCLLNQDLLFQGWSSK